MAPSAESDGTLVVESGHIVNEREAGARNGGTFDVPSPYDRRVVARVPAGTELDIEAAVEAADAAFPVWSSWTPAQREKAFFDVADLVHAAKDRFGVRPPAPASDCLQIAKPTRITTQTDRTPVIVTVSWLVDEGGSAVTKAEFETKYAIDVLRTAGGEARRLYGDTFPADRNERLSIVVREPMGVIGAISPFNAPLILLIKMIAFPIAGGNTIVAKPSEETPMVAIELAKLFVEAGFPNGVFNVVTGLGRDVGEPLVRHPKVRGITFTGSTSVGRKIASIASERMARIHMELGGKNPVIVLRDANLEEAAAQIALGAFAHAPYMPTRVSTPAVRDRALTTQTRTQERSPTPARFACPPRASSLRRRSRDLLQRRSSSASRRCSLAICVTPRRHTAR